MNKLIYKWRRAICWWKGCDIIKFWDNPLHKGSGCQRCKRADVEEGVYFLGCLYYKSFFHRNICDEFPYPDEDM